VNNSDDQEEPDASEALSPEDDNDATEERNEVNPRSAEVHEGRMRRSAQMTGLAPHRSKYRAGRAAADLVAHFFSLFSNVFVVIPA